MQRSCSDSDPNYILFASLAMKKKKNWSVYQFEGIFRALTNSELAVIQILLETFTK